jgi:RNA polymerase sigma-B factor
LEDRLSLAEPPTTTADRRDRRQAAVPTRATRVLGLPREAEEDVLARFVETRSRADRDRLVQAFAPLARSLVRRYSKGHHDVEDLDQIAMVGLIQALERYEPDRGAFKSFAVATVLGELRHHFRDHSSSIRLPRRLQELAARTGAASTELAGELGREPTVREIARRCGLPIETVLEALEAEMARHATSLDLPIGEDGGTSLAQMIPWNETGYAQIELNDAACDAAISDQDLEMLRMYYGRHMKQSEIARRFGISQMQVSRLIRAALKRMLAEVEAAEGIGQ